MPFAREPSSPLGAEDFLRDEEVKALLERCRIHNDPQASKNSILERVIDASRWIERPQRGLLIASDGSSYEASISENFPSARMGLLKIGQVCIDLAQYGKIDPRVGGVPDPIAIARLERQKTAYSIALMGAGVRLDGETPSDGFRRSIFEAFRSPRFAIGQYTLESTLVELLEIGGHVRTVGGRRNVVLAKGRKCPATGQTLSEDVLVPEDAGFAPSPHDSNRILFVTDSLRLSEAFADEGSNQQAYTRTMNALEHLLLIHALRFFDQNGDTRASIAGGTFLVDGPLAVFGEPARLHGPIMKWIDRFCRSMDNPPIVMGITKSGRVVEHGRLIAPVLEEAFPNGETLILPIDDHYRYSFIDPGAKNPSTNFGEHTHYGQAFIVRSSSGRVFEMNLAYPMGTKGAGFQAEKVKLSNYGNALARALSVLDTFETELYQDANIAQHLAHRCASIAHKPAGRTLDMFLRGVVRKQ